MSIIGTLVRAVPGRYQESGDGPGAEPEADDTGGSGAALFHCPRCDTVYVATAKDACSDCETAVSRVPSTLGAE